MVEWVSYFGHVECGHVECGHVECGRVDMWNVDAWTWGMSRQSQPVSAKSTRLGEPRRPL